MQGYQVKIGAIRFPERVLREFSMKVNWQMSFTFSMRPKAKAAPLP